MEEVFGEGGAGLTCDGAQKHSGVVPPAAGGADALLAGQGFGGNGVHRSKRSHSGSSFFPGSCRA